MTKKQRRPEGMLISDEEIRERAGDKADEVIADLDSNRATRKEQFYKGFRVRQPVEKRLAEILKS